MTEHKNIVKKKEDYLSKSHMLRDGITHGALAPLGGLALEQLTENVPHYLSGDRGVSSVEYGLPFIWKQVSSTVTQNPTVTTTYNMLNHAANAAFWVAIVEVAGYASLRLIDKYQSWRLGKKLKELENSK